MEQLRHIFLKYDDNKNLSFEPNEIENILRSVFNFKDEEIRMIMFEIFKLDARYETTISFEDLVAILLDIFFVYIWLIQRYDDVGKKGWKLRKINCA